jgi:hypothetical protein
MLFQDFENGSARYASLRKLDMGKVQPKAMNCIAYFGNKNPSLKNGANQGLG